MKKVIVFLMAATLSACSLIPSFYDDNASKAIVDVRYSVEHLDCSYDHALQVSIIKNDLRWLNLFVESKGSDDVLELLEPMNQTVNDFHKRATSEKGSSNAYCELKKEILTIQSEKAAKAILGRF